MIREAARAAAALGMSVKPHPTDPSLCEVFCPACGWGRGLADQVCKKVAAAPYGCTNGCGAARSEQRRKKG